jgi:hypothetical protein
LPAFGPDTVKVAIPLPFKDCVIAAPLSTLKDTVPVGVPTKELIVTVTIPSAWYVTLGVLITAVVTAGFTVKLPSPELPRKIPVGGYVALKV